MENVTKHHEQAAINHTLGLKVSERMYAGLQKRGLVERRGDDWALTERGCDLAVGRATVKNGRIVRAR